MSFSPLVHIIALGLVGWFYSTARRVDREGEHRGAAFGLTVAMLAWIALSTWLALEDFYYEQNPRFLAAAAAAIFTVVAGAGAALLIPPLRGLTDLLTRKLPLQDAIRVQALRATALGTIFKMMSGDLPASFVLAAGVPDTLFGVSAFFVARKADALPRRFLAAWNIAGVLIFIVALVAMQLSLPGPLQLFTEAPTTRVAVSFPMALVPTFIAPALILVHFLSLAQIAWRRRTATQDRVEDVKQKIDALRILDARRFEVWSFFEHRADEIKSRLWTTATWLIALKGALLGFILSQNFVVFEGPGIKLANPLIVSLLSGLGVALVILTWTVVDDMASHIRLNWRRASAAKGDPVRTGRIYVLLPLNVVELFFAFSFATLLAFAFRGRPLDWAVVGILSLVLLATLAYKLGVLEKRPGSDDRSAPKPDDQLQASPSNEDA